MFLAAYVSKISFASPESHWEGTSDFTRLASPQSDRFVKLFLTFHRKTNPENNSSFDTEGKKQSYLLFVYSLDRLKVYYLL